MAGRTKLANLMDSHPGKTIHVIGSAGTMADYIDLVRDDDITIAVGDAALRGEGLFRTDYWVAANDDFPVYGFSPHLEIINRVTSKCFVFCDAALYSRKWVKRKDSEISRLLRCEWCTYDQRHFDKKPCEPRSQCCELISEEKREDTIQEVVARRFKADKLYSQGNTVAIHALALALLLGGDRIIIHGIEIPRSPEEYTYYPSKEADKVPIPTFLDWDRKVFREGKSTLRSRLRVFSRMKAVIKQVIRSIGIRMSMRTYNHEDIDIDPWVLIGEGIQVTREDYGYLVNLAEGVGKEVICPSKTSLFFRVPS